MESFNYTTYKVLFHAFRKKDSFLTRYKFLRILIYCHSSHIIINYTSYVISRSYEHHRYHLLIKHKRKHCLFLSHFFYSVFDLKIPRNFMTAVHDFFQECLLQYVNLTWVPFMENSPFVLRLLEKRARECIKKYICFVIFPATAGAKKHCVNYQFRICKLFSQYSIII